MPYVFLQGVKVFAFVPFRFLTAFQEVIMDSVYVHHSHGVTCPACGEKFDKVDVPNCPVCGTPDSSYPHFVEILLKEAGEIKKSVRIRFCCGNHAILATGSPNISFNFKDGSYVGDRAVEMTNDRYAALMIQLSTLHPVA
jgi:hypothetical protein